MGTDDLCGGGDPGNKIDELLEWVGEGVWMVRVGITSGGGSIVIVIPFLIFLGCVCPDGGGC